MTFHPPGIVQVSNIPFPLVHGLSIMKTTQSEDDATLDTDSPWLREGNRRRTNPEFIQTFKPTAQGPFPVLDGPDTGHAQRAPLYLDSESLMNILGT
jgi:hypothetical protein